MIKNIGTIKFNLKHTAGKIDEHIIDAIEEAGYLIEDVGCGEFNIYEETVEDEEDNDDNTEPDINP